MIVVSTSYHLQNQQHLIKGWGIKREKLNNDLEKWKLLPNLFLKGSKFWIRITEIANFQASNHNLRIKKQNGEKENNFFSIWVKPHKTSKTQDLTDKSTKRSKLCDGNKIQTAHKPTSRLQNRIKIPHLDPLRALRLLVQILLGTPLFQTKSKSSNRKLKHRQRDRLGSKSKSPNLGRRFGVGEIYNLRSVLHFEIQEAPF